MSILALVRPPPKSIFDIHDPVRIKWLYQLRVGLSPLYEHKMKHNFSDTISDKCDVCKHTENLEHFFLHCTRYTEARRTLLNFVLTINDVNFEQLQSREQIKMLLYGDVTLCASINKLILQATLDFLRDSERFM